MVNYNYNTGLDDSISRLSSLSDNSGTLESYSYLGLGTVVKRAHSQPGVDLTYIKQSGESNGDAGDQYTGLDRFGRVVDQRWINTGTSTATDRFKYGYDRNGNVLYRTNEVNHSFDELYHANGSGNGYDNLNQLVAFARGTLNAGHDTISSPSHSITYSLDAEGNFASTTTDGGSAVNNTFNKQNEETAAGASTLAFDSNGNLTTDDQGHTLVYDAWNRLVTVKNGGSTLTSYKYDALSRRIVENPGTVHDLYYDAAWQILEERWAGVSTATIQYVWSPVYIDALVLRDRSTLNNGTLDERLWVQQDANYNVTALVNGSGSVVERYAYDPYGKQTVLDATFNTRASSSYAFIHGFQGLRLDTTSGMYNARNRDLSPTLGRWVQADQSGFTAGDTNLYRDLGNGPTDHTDPSGLNPFMNYWNNWIVPAAEGAADRVLWFGRRANPALIVETIKEDIATAKAIWNDPFAALEQAAQQLDDASAGVQLVGGYKAAFPKNEEDIAHAKRAARASGAQTVDVAAAVGIGCAIPVRPFRPRGARLVNNIAPKSISRPLTAKDIGLRGNIQELTGTFKVKGPKATIRIDMIRGQIKSNMVEMFQKAKSLAKENGATTLRIEGTLANAQLDAALRWWFPDLTTVAGIDFIEIVIN